MAAAVATTCEHQSRRLHPSGCTAGVDGVMTGTAEVLRSSPERYPICVTVRSLSTTLRLRCHRPGGQHNLVNILPLEPDSGIAGGVTAIRGDAIEHQKTSLGGDMQADGQPLP